MAVETSEVPWDPAGSPALVGLCLPARPWNLRAQCSEAVLLLTQ